MDLVFLTTEAVPFAKTGGLGDVCGALPATLQARGHRVSVIMPAFSSIRNAGLSIEQTDQSFAIPMRDRVIGARLLRSRLPGSEVDVYFIDQPQYFDRPALYGDARGDYQDNCERFSFYCRAALQVIARTSPQVDIVHCNDWQTGLVPAYMKYRLDNHTWMDRARSVMTVHNLAYQGQFWHHDLPLTGLGWEHFHADGLEFYGSLNFLKTGILLADWVTTVSPTYAAEITTAWQGCGLDGVLRSKGDRLVGIANGIDTEHWNPATDPLIPKQYDVTSWKAGKAENKRQLQVKFGLPQLPDVPLIGLVGRLADQKGWDLVVEVMKWHLEQDRPVQWAILGTGELRYHDALAHFAAQYPDRVALELGFSNQLAHWIEAAADLFLMPSRYEPCGLNQLYSLRYGTVPVVTATGGLVDTVVNTTDQSLAAKEATGFHVAQFSATELDAAIGRALSLRYHQPDLWAQLVETGMRADWSWGVSAQQYEEVYADACSLEFS